MWKGRNQEEMTDKGKHITKLSNSIVNYANYFQVYIHGVLATTNASILLYSTKTCMQTCARVHVQNTHTHTHTHTTQHTHTHTNTHTHAHTHKDKLAGLKSATKHPHGILLQVNAVPPLANIRKTKTCF